VVTDGVDGVLVPPASPEPLAEALIRLARSSALRRRLGEAGYVTVRDRFSIDAAVRRVEAVYDEELRRAGVPARGASRLETPAPPAGRRPRGRAALEVPPA
jgi:hypothetical protein